MIYRQLDQSQMYNGVLLETSQWLAINPNTLQQVMSLVRINTLWRQFSLLSLGPENFLS